MNMYTYNNILIKLRKNININLYTYKTMNMLKNLTQNMNNSFELKTNHVNWTVNMNKNIKMSWTLKKYPIKKN